MSEQKHTPGPWESCGVSIESQNGTYIAVLRSTNSANARLIAAAPELLRTLQHIADLTPADELRDLPGIRQSALAAIAKATVSNAD